MRVKLLLTQSIFYSKIYIRFFYFVVTLPYRTQSNTNVRVTEIRNEHIKQKERRHALYLVGYNAEAELTMKYEDTKTIAIMTNATEQKFREALRIQSVRSP